MAEKLTPQQYAAVVNRGGRLLVSAAAGSGKTKVLVDRLLSYLEDPADPADLDSFLIITYTKAAATELRGKIAAKLTARIAEDPNNRHLQKQIQRLFLAKISTVHGFCSDILREYAYRLDLPADFRVADEVECREIRDRVLTELLDQAYSEVGNDDFRAFVDSQGLGRTDRLVPEIIEKVYDSSRCHLDPDKWIQDCIRESMVSAISDAGETLWGKYLMQDLFSYLDKHIFAMEQLRLQSEMYPELDKVTANLRSIIEQLSALRGSDTWDTIVAQRQIDYGRLTFPRKNNPDPDLSDRIKAVRSACKKGMERKLQSFIDPSRLILNDLQESEASIRGLFTLVSKFEHAYTAAKKSRRCLDFSDLEQNTLTLLLGKNRSGPTVAAEEIAKRYREIMVDEYQDSNAVQDAILSALTGKRKNGFMVGDVKQSIYLFRLADPGIFLEKYNSFLPYERAGNGEGRKILLSHNFRSGGEVIEAVNDVFTCCMRPERGGLLYTEEEALREGIPHKPLPDPAVELYAVDVREDAYHEEAEFVAEKIQYMLSTGMLIRDGDSFRPVTADDIVILLRSPGSGGASFQRALDRRGIRCISGSGLDILKTQEIATIRSLLQTIMNPRQDIPLISILASPVFGFTADELGKIRSKQKKGSFYDALIQDQGDHTAYFMRVLRNLREAAQKSSLTSLLEQCLNLTRLDSIYRAMDGGSAKAENIQQFFQMAADFEKGNVRDLGQFLEHLTALDNKGSAAAKTASSGCVTIMSIHKSKGLEFPVVFLCNLSRRFNQENLRAQILCDKDLGIGTSIADSRRRVRYPSLSKRAISVKMGSEGISEEMRVLYVAMTRARDRLIMTYASSRLGADLAEIAQRTDADSGALVCMDAMCMGEWVLLCALKKIEAGQLHAIGDRPAQTYTGTYPWKIGVVEANEAERQNPIPDAVKKNPVSDETLQMLRKHLQFDYKYQQATNAPSKQTATGRKGRMKDEEAASNTRPSGSVYRTWRKPSFMESHEASTIYGNVMHKALQGIRFECCGSEVSIASEITRMITSGFLDPEHAKLVSTSKLAAFFDSEIGKKLRCGVPCVREFKFSILDDGCAYGDGLEGEKVLLQGVVDCALLEPDGITVLDFKTDRITEEKLPDTIERYRPQVEAYSQAISRIYEQNVKAKYLYFFQLNRFVEV